MWTDGYGNEPYDPDMSVQEALDNGLIAVIDTGAIGRGPYEPCRYGSLIPSRPDLTCTRNKGHEGVHAFVLRWQVSHDDAERQRRIEAAKVKREEAEKRKVAAERADFARKMAQIEKTTKKVDDVLQKKLQRDLDREWSAIPRNFRDQSAGKIRGPKR